jgi:hypothetical protein
MDVSMNRATSRALGKASLRDNGCPNNAGGYHVTRPINNFERGRLERAGLTDEQVERYVCCRMCGKMGPPQLVVSRPEVGP